MSDMSKFANKFPSIIQNYSKEEIIEIFKQGNNKNQIARIFGYKDNGYKIVERLCQYFDIDIKQFWWYLHPRTPNRQGQIINNWQILEYDSETSIKNKKTYWKVKCQCGNPNIYSISDDNLIRNRSTCCGKCQTYKKVGKTYGFLEILEITKWEHSKNGKSAPKAKVLCHNCGKISEHYISSITSQNSIACGCFNKSMGEEKIKQLLLELKIKYEEQKTFNDLKDRQKLSYDFYLPEYNILIEFQGEQHYRPINHWGGQERFSIQQHHDFLKEEYAKKNNIKLICINYKDFSKINAEYILNLLKEGD